MILKIVLGFAALLALLCLIVALQPSDYRITRSATIAAPPAVVFEQINNLRKSLAWNPWVKLDPAAQFGFEGPPAGVGAVSTWSGNDQMGAGRQSIIESQPNELVRTRLDFIRPMASTANAEFILKSDAGQTVVTWSMYGKNNFVGRAMCLVMNMDKMLGGFFDEGLGKLKTIAEAGGAQSNPVPGHANTNP